MKVYYSRVSTQEQNDDRQLTELSHFDYVFKDKCSGSINLFDRAKGSQIKQLIDQNMLSHLEVHSIDRLGRNTIDVLKVWQFLTDKKIKVVCRNPQLTNFKEDGSMDEVSQMIISILSVMSSFERKIIIQRQLEGIQIAKAKGVYKGRKVGTIESTEKYLNKNKTLKIISLLKKRYKYNEICKILNCSNSTVLKTKKLLLNN